MKSKLVVLTLLAAGTMALAAVTPARAQNVTIRVDTPEFGIRIGHPGYRPAPVIVAPAPVYVPPPPVYVPPPPVEYYPAPRVIYAPPPRVIYAPPPAVVYYPHPHYGRYYKHKHHRHHHDDDDDDHRRHGRYIEEVRVRY
jgi:hypothetical protein